MNARRKFLLSLVLTAAALTAGFGVPRGSAHTSHTAESAGGKIGFEIPGTMEDLKLKYDLVAQDNGGNRVSITFTLADEGRLKPLSAVQLGVPSKDGSGYYDVVASLAASERDGKKLYTLQLTRDLLERGELSLITHTLDGKPMTTWGYHRVSFAAAAKAMDAKAGAQKPAPGEPKP